MCIGEGREFDNSVAEELDPADEAGVTGVERKGEGCHCGEIGVLAEEGTQGMEEGEEGCWVGRWVVDGGSEEVGHE